MEQAVAKCQPGGEINQKNIIKSTVQWGKQTSSGRGALTWLLLGLRGGASLARDEHAGAGAFALGAWRGEEEGAHAGRGRRRLLRLLVLERGPCGRIEGMRRGTIAGGSFRPTHARAPRRRRSDGELLLPLILENLLLLQGIKL